MTLTRAERDQFTASTPDDIAYGEGACLETPRYVFDRLHERFKFDLDLTANEHNHLTPHWLGPGSVFVDALDAPWYGLRPYPDGPLMKVGYSNPPFGPFIPKILTKALAERAKGFASVFLLPMRASGWYRNIVLPNYSFLWHLETRLTFPYMGKPRINMESKRNKEIAEWNRVRTLDGGTQYAYQADSALFDCIVVGFLPMGQGQLFPPAQRPNVWNPRTGELRY